MHLRTRRRRPFGVPVALALALAFPTLALAGPAAAAPAAGRSKPVAAPASDVLAVLEGLVAQLLPGRAAPAAPPLPPAVVSQGIASTVRISSVACGVRLSGSGFSTGPNTIVTNAHVVAGSLRTQVSRPDGRTLEAQVQVFDPDRDLAVLAVPDLDQPSLALGSAVPGETTAAFGYPRGQATVRVAPAVVVRRVTADVGDIYDQPAPPRQILVLDTRLQPGDSGAPLVNSDGKVVGVAFAVSNLRRSTGFAVASEELAPVLARPRSGPVDTGPCLA